MCTFRLLTFVDRRNGNGHDCGNGFQFRSHCIAAFFSVSSFTPHIFFHDQHDRERWHENCFGKLNAVTFNYVIIQHVDMSELWTRKLRWECDIEEKRIGFIDKAQKNVLIWRLHQFSVIMWLQEQKTTPTSRRERCICREAIDILDDATCFRL